MDVASDGDRVGAVGFLSLPFSAVIGASLASAGTVTATSVAAFTARLWFSMG